MTLPQGLQGSLRPSETEGDTLADLHRRIREMLETRRRSEQDAAVVLRLDPLLLSGAQADELGLVSSLRREFGPEAHLSVTAAGGGVFVMAARAGRQNAVAAAVRRRLDAVAPTRLTGTRPGILAMFVEDTDRAEWQGAARPAGAGRRDAAVPDASRGAAGGRGQLRVPPGTVRHGRAGRRGGWRAALSQPRASGGEGTRPGAIGGFLHMILRRVAQFTRRCTK